MLRFFIFSHLIFTMACHLTTEKSSVHEEKDGYLEVEAEDFHSQELTEIRKWYRMDAKSKGTDKIGVSNKPNLSGGEMTNSEVLPDGDENHSESASGNAYMEILPDSRRTHDDELIAGENFSNEPGKLAVLHYRVKINNPGKYYVWVRAYSTGTEDNGLHVGLNGEWPESGQRMQWCEDKNQWTWASKQRMPEEHCGIEERIFLEIDEPGLHTVSFSMREDGFEFDKWIMSTSYHY
jgi:hypothetical protein